MEEFKWYALQVEAGKEATARENLLKVLELEGLLHQVKDVESTYSKPFLSLS